MSKKTTTCSVLLTDAESKIASVFATLAGRSKSSFLREIFLAHIEEQSSILAQVKQLTETTTGNDLARGGGDETLTSK